MPRQRELSMPIPRWQKPATKYYDNNYSFGMNFYQPMIDWLDDRDRGLRPRPPPHLPWLNERGLKKYDPSQQGIKTYSAGRAEQLAVEAQLRAQESLRETKEGPIFHPRSPFSLAKQVEVATSLTKKVLGHSSYEERHADKYLKEKELADLRRRTEEALLDLNPRRIMATTDLESSSYRAKSRRAIANELIMESMRHLQDSRTEEQIRKAYSDTRRGVRTYQTPYWFLADGSVVDNPYLNRSPRQVAGDILTGSLKVLQECETTAQVRHALRTARKDLNHYFNPIEDKEDIEDRKKEKARQRQLLMKTQLLFK
ncbi:paramyosin, short form [Frankliniella occidentalis]|uniref:Paramyosin, short form n=1 Tax=Frankliniella occidentalis TaxID=133901 RepID=A0A9C6X384_FRAOC|nr:paramyosin, short form [Frankliniella occidentalis]